ncbi:MAG: hypothetical protein ACOYNC_12065 [Bacteroidales bacterium]
MKKMNFFLVLMIVCLAGTTLYATKWRVNNAGIPANFTTANAAVNSPLVMDGDTVYFESSMFVYDGFNLVKRLVLIGPGYYLADNDSTQADPKPATLQSITFSNGSQGSIMKGISFSSSVQVSTSNITLEKNYIMGGFSLNNCSGISILRNYILYLSLNTAQNVLISNNIFVSENQFGNCLTIDASASASVINNIFFGKLNVNNSVFRNNILTCTSLSQPFFMSNNSLVQNNIGASNQFAVSNGNLANVDMTTVFVNTGGAEAKFKLKPGSPAIGAGVGGADCGMFGGNYPYVLSGMVTGPSVWYMNMNGIDVTVKAKSH